MLTKCSTATIRRACKVYASSNGRGFSGGTTNDKFSTGDFCVQDESLAVKAGENTRELVQNLQIVVDAKGITMAIVAGMGRHGP